jgi:hypothetical protein
VTLVKRSVMRVRRSTSTDCLMADAGGESADVGLERKGGEMDVGAEGKGERGRGKGQKGGALLSICPRS